MPASTFRQRTVGGIISWGVGAECLLVYDAVLVPTVCVWFHCKRVLRTALHAELDQCKQQLDTERQQRTRARNDHERLQAQLDTIRDLLNPRQRQSL